MLGRILFTAPLLIGLIGCTATKNYGRVYPMGPQEAKLYDCERLKDEKARVESFFAHVRAEAQMDYRTVAAVIYPYNLGISNITERHYAEKYAQERLDQIEARLKDGSCQFVASIEPSSDLPKAVPALLADAPGPIKAGPITGGLVADKAHSHKEKPKSKPAPVAPEGAPQPQLKAFTLPDSAFAPPLNGERTR